MKNFKKGFTLVEMLIVVVIIGILSAALLPRLQGAQSSARDAARRSDLNQLGSAILSYYNNRGEYPWPKNCTGFSKLTEWYTWMIPAVCIRDTLMQVVELSSLPTDPNKGNSFKYWPTNNEATISWWQYWYIKMKKNSIDDWWYLLMARSETEWWSNFVSTIKLENDLKDVRLCTSFELWTWSEKVPENWKCTYKDKWDLRYVYIF